MTHWKAMEWQTEVAAASGIRVYMKRRRLRPTPWEAGS
jgi:hypothetical protein